jgi:hypothetical protein
MRMRHKTADSPKTCVLVAKDIFDRGTSLGFQVVFHALLLLNYYQAYMSTFKLPQIRKIIESAEKLEI